MSLSSNPVLRSAAGIATLLALGISISPLRAQDNPVVTARSSDLPTAIVKFGDLNLASDVGQKSLYGRVDKAIEGLCPMIGIMPLDQVSLAKGCRSFAWASAEPQIQRALESARSNGALAQAGSSLVIAARR